MVSGPEGETALIQQLGEDGGQQENGGEDCLLPRVLVVERLEV
jgi:hypothetical protein